MRNANLQLCIFFNDFKLKIKILRKIPPVGGFKCHNKNNKGELLYMKELQ